MKRTLIGLATVIALLAAPALAQADSLVFVKENNVWLAKPDGSGQYQVTTDGTAENPYASPSQADDGTIVAARSKPNGAPLIRMKQNGDVINRIELASMIAGPFRPQVSPDGKLVAYEHVFGRWINGYFETSSDVRITRTDGTGGDLGEVGRGAGSPSWIDSSRLLAGVNSTVYTKVVGEPAVQWWSDYDHQPDYFPFGETVEDGEYANGLVVIPRGDDHDGNTLQFYRAGSDFTTVPTPQCMFTEPADGPNGRRFADPTFSPSGDALAWQEGDGIWTSGSDCQQAQPRLLIAGASQPDWGPADVNPGPKTPPPPPPCRDSSCNPPPPPPPPTKLKLGLSTVKAVRLAAVRKNGLVATVKVPTAGRVTVRASIGSRALGSRAVTAKKAGTLTIRVRPGSALAKALKKAKSVRVTVTATQGRLGASATTTVRR